MSTYSCVECKFYAKPMHNGDIFCALTGRLNVHRFEPGAPDACWDYEYFPDPEIQKIGDLIVSLGQTVLSYEIGEPWNGTRTVIFHCDNDNAVVVLESSAFKWKLTFPVGTIECFNNANGCDMRVTQDGTTFKRAEYIRR